MVLKKDDDARSEKKRRRVNFSTIDVGVEANDCIKFFLVSSHEEMDRSEGSGVQVDMNQFFGEDGKIYGYKDLKGSKGITNVDQVLKNIFGESLISEKDDFAQTFSRECLYIRDIVSTAEVLKKYSFEDEVVRLKLNEPPVGKLYSRLIPVLLLLVEGSSPVDTTDPRWEIYLAVRKTVDQSGDVHCVLLGFATIYHFYHYPDASRLRIGQSHTAGTISARCASTVAEKSSGGLFSWLTGERSCTLPPLNVPLPGVSLPPPLPDYVEPGKTKVTTLPNGVKIASETSTNPAASIGLFVDCGSVYETPISFGATHLLERMAFKSTTNRSHLRTVREVETIGGNVMASASREQMCYS